MSLPQPVEWYFSPRVATQPTGPSEETQVPEYHFVMVSVIETFGPANRLQLGAVLAEFLQAGDDGTVEE